MVKKICKPNNDQRGRRFHVFGRRLPTDANPEPEVIVVRVFAPNQAIAKSKFWKLNKRDHKLKKRDAEIVRVSEVFDGNNTVPRNYGVYLKYRSRTGFHNTFKEYRATSLKEAVNQMYDEMGGNYKCSSDRIQILQAHELTKDQLKVRNPKCLQWVDTENIKFPLWKRTARPTNTKYNTDFAANRPVIMKTGVTIDK